MGGQARRQRQVVGSLPRMIREEKETGVRDPTDPFALLRRICPGVVAAKPKLVARTVCVLEWCVWWWLQSIDVATTGRGIASILWLGE